VTETALPRQLAQSTLDALKKAGHIVLSRGETESVVRELSRIIDPVLKRVLPRMWRSPIMGEVTSTFGDEATDEAMEALVEELRDALLDSDGVEDVFAEDPVIERAIFRTLGAELRALVARGEEPDDEVPPISVRLETLGYVATAAAKSADEDTLKDALERAAEAAKSELETYDSASRTAFFRPSEPDPDRRLDIESAIEEELSDLVDMGMLPLPTIVRQIELGGPVDRAERRAMSRTLDALVERHLKSAICPGTWEWSEAGELSLVFTPLTEPDPELVTKMAEAFTQELRSTMGGPKPSPPKADAGLAALLAAAAKSVAPPKTGPKSAVPKPAPSKPGVAKKPEAKEPAAPKKPAAKKSASATAKKPAAKKPAAKKSTRAD
jgi:hypothetical protein